MDITQVITYRGLQLTGAVGGAGGANPVQGIRLTRVRYGDVTVFGYTEKRSLDDGYDASDVYLGQRTVILQGEVFARSKAALFDLLDVMRLTFTPTDAYNEDPRDQGYRPLVFRQPTTLVVDWTDGWIDRVLNCRPVAQPEHEVQFAALQGNAPSDDNDGGYVVPFTQRLIAKDPRFYYVTDKEYEFTGTYGTAIPLRNRGNYPAPLNFVLGSSTAGQKIFTFVGMGTHMTVTIPDLTGTRTVQVDGNLKVVTMTVGTVETLRMDLITFSSGLTWPKVPPTPQSDTTPPTFDWSSGGAGFVAGSRLFFREAWA